MKLVPPVIRPNKPQDDDPGLVQASTGADGGGDRQIRRRIEEIVSTRERIFPSSDAVSYTCQTCQDTGFEIVDAGLSKFSGTPVSSAAPCRSCEKGKQIGPFKRPKKGGPVSRERLRAAIKQERLSTWQDDSGKGDD